LRNAPVTVQEQPEEVSMQCAQLLGIIGKFLAIFLQAPDIAQCEPPHDAPVDGIRPVKTEIDTGRVAEKFEDRDELIMDRRVRFERPRVVIFHDVGVTAQFRQLCGNSFR
jgi:hypothetical protein